MKKTLPQFCLLYILFFGLTVSVSFCAASPPLKAAPVICDNDEIETDTVWKGEVHVLKRVSLLEGVTLTIEPGTVVRFAKDFGLRANGNIRAIGLKDKPILFSIMDGEAADAHWHQIMLENSNSVFEHCIFERASVGLHSHFSDLLVRNSRFIHNETGMMFKGGPVSINNAEFSGNVFGVVFNTAKGKVNNSAITNNEVGIMVRAQEKDGIIAHNNNIFANSRYNLKMGDFNNGINIDVSNNYWGVADPADTMFDDRFEPGIGKAVYRPFLSEKLKIKN